jgi:hypothetical protein
MFLCQDVDDRKHAIRLAIFSLSRASDGDRITTYLTTKSMRLQVKNKNEIVRYIL